ncbi:MAG: IclR family transcriptional regulator [Desulfobacterales bacterium]|nr:IclR family transcriptional regulator [Desulfobacterales bacterium]
MKINSIERCLKVIDILSDHPKGLKLTEISGHLDLHPSSVHHMVSTLLPHDYITQDPDTKKYSLGFRFLEISRKILDNLDIRKVAHRHLEVLRQEIREAVHLAMLRDDKVVYIDKLDTPSGLSLATYVGFATDPHAAAGGKVLLAGLKDDEVKGIYKNKSLKAYNKNTITRLPALMAELDRIRKQGYAVDNEEYYEGVRCVAAPVRSGGQVVASISVTGSIFTMTQERIEKELAAKVVKTAGSVSDELHW